MAAEKVAVGVAEQAKRYLDAGVPVGEQLADQLLIPFALAGGGSFRTLSPSAHTLTNIAVLGRFLDLKIVTAEERQDVWLIRMDSARPG